MASDLAVAPELVAKAGVEVRLGMPVEVVEQQTTATMEVAAVSVADVQQQAEKLAMALGGRLMVGYGGLRQEKIEELGFGSEARTKAAPAVFVELPTAQVAAFKERLLAEIGTELPRRNWPCRRMASTPMQSISRWQQTH